MRPADDWIRQERPELTIVDAELWDAVQTRLAEVNAPASGQRGGPGRAAYSPYLLSGLLRCGVCGARMHAQTVESSGCRRISPTSLGSRISLSTSICRAPRRTLTRR